MRKYRNQPVEIDGIKFDSKREAVHYGLLKFRESVGEIKNLRCHVRYPIEVNGRKICHIEPDFEFYDVREDATKTQDIKGYKITEDWRIKAKLFEAIYGREIEVVR